MTKAIATEFEKNCFGMSESNIRSVYMKMADEFAPMDINLIAMRVMGMLSDCQELLKSVQEYNDVNDVERIRKTLNLSKFMLAEVMDGVDVSDLQTVQRLTMQ
jgi:DNA-binding transcriptional regulator YiaG